MAFDYKINREVQFQLGYDKNYIIHFQEYKWDDKPVLEADCKITREKTYRNVTKSSLNRISKVVNNAVYNKVGRLELWITNLGWTYKDFGNWVEKEA